MSPNTKKNQKFHNISQFTGYNLAETQPLNASALKYANTEFY